MEKLCYVLASKTRQYEWLYCHLEDQDSGNATLLAFQHLIQAQLQFQVYKSPRSKGKKKGKREPLPVVKWFYILQVPAKDVGKFSTYQLNPDQKAVPTLYCTEDERRIFGLKMKPGFISTFIGQGFPLPVNIAPDKEGLSEIKLEVNEKPLMFDYRFGPYIISLEK